ASWRAAQRDASCATVGGRAAGGAAHDCAHAAPAGGGERDGVDGAGAGDAQPGGGRTTGDGTCGGADGDGGGDGANRSARSRMRQGPASPGAAKTPRRRPPTTPGSTGVVSNWSTPRARRYQPPRNLPAIFTTPLHSPPGVRPRSDPALRKLHATPAPDRSRSTRGTL